MNQALNLDDAELLKRFVHARDEASFEELVRRHGPAVLGACRRICPAPEAEDAAQAVFLTLAQKAHALRVHATLGPWLHRVAVCVSRDARRTAQARTKREQEAALAMQRADGNEALEELKPVLDEAIDALPEAYRAPLVLHHLEGLTHEAAAERLGLKSSTLSMRLTRGRELLRERLAQRGAIVSLSVLSAGLASLALGSPPSAAFAASTAKIAVLLASGQTIAAGTISAQASALTQGALKMLFLQKLQWTAAAGLAALLAITVTTSAVLKAADGERDATRSRPSPELRNAPPRRRWPRPRRNRPCSPA
ncbi:MAG: sigma-70 family RNA polymerase sigma factor [Planctomycetota bacterium]|nr:sigma-70 family RNA polymerase sigma factor [Planctomycetota bacterium]